MLYVAHSLAWNLKSIAFLAERNISILSCKHPQGYEGEVKLVIGVCDHATLVEDTFNSFLQPLPIWLLPAHDELQTLLDRRAVRILRLH